ncbi:hypothetical protein [Aurantiacibacter sp. D1-12]|uniref:hypothetical protein n=1 Tax=Aurantiacibacter sp. D1-12 TaxID=2993658 RepID=UPI00237D1277|nr:hypothetical protein [Aurantiacibacter sp. D1-12]MDE1467904.1 hypothetical protein [Aurantiacibacter sp. D1-12]
MLKFAPLAVIAAALLCNPAQAQRVDLDEVELRAQAGVPVEVVINDQPVQILIAPDAVSAVSMNGDAAERLGFEPSMVGFVYVIGPERLRFSTDTVRYHMQGGTFRRRTAYSERQIVEGADGVVGPGHFPQERVVLTLREPTERDRAITYPLERMGRTLAGTLIEAGGVPIYVAFSFDRPETLVSATGGRILADDYRGYFDGEARFMPVLYGVDRPVRRLTLRDPLMLGELEVRNIAVRVSDHGSSEGIDEEAPEEGDPDEIVVTANTGDIPRQRMYVGMDTIGHCASITYDFDEEVLTLMCPDQPPAGSVPIPSDEPEAL